MLLLLLDGLWHLLMSGVVALATLASIVGAYPVMRSFMRRRAIRYGRTNATILQHEHAYLCEALGDLNTRDSYWRDDQYIPLDVAAAMPVAVIPPEFFSVSANRLGWLDTLTSRAASRRSTDLARLLRRRHDPVVVLGDPGAGKSVAIRHAMRHLITRAQHWYVAQPLLPLYVPCSYYTATDGSGPVSVDVFLAEYVTSTFVAFRGALDFLGLLKGV